jgi:nitrite reductase (cytochrome c-552)
LQLSPVELSRIIASGIAMAQEARIKLARVLASLGFNEEIPYPDIATKAKAQIYIGLEMIKLYEEKKIFLETILPGWIEAGKEREKSYE